MTHLTRLIGACALGACAVLSVHAWADGDAAAGYQKNRMCEGCHGIPDFRTVYPDVYRVPKLGGQSAAYIVKALQDYRSGARKHPSMNGIAGSLSDQDMADLAAYYSSSDSAK
ncbi:MAG TPA: cytochrome c [Steroidobacteraceae bacterium]|nr:cytochrome c [Steroidobacteraceae bacterium]